MKLVLGFLSGFVGCLLGNCFNWCWSAFGRKVVEKAGGWTGAGESRGDLGKVEMLKAEMKTALQKPGVGKIVKSSDRFNCPQANLS